MTKNHTDTSKFLSYILRHKPDSINLDLDPEGWANINELIAKASIPLSLELLQSVVASSDKKRFAISANNQSIRANQGHSITVDLGLEATAPPEFLYHGTATIYVDSIMEKGLLPQNRQYVHLSTDKLTATSVGRRHGKPIILTIPALAMHKKGYQFFLAKNDVWLTGKITPELIQYTRPI